VKGLAGKRSAPYREGMTLRRGARSILAIAPRRRVNEKGGAAVRRRAGTGDGKREEEEED